MQQQTDRRNDNATRSFVDQVNVLQGTRSSFSFSTGNCLPLVAMPFGMTHWSPQTAEERGGWFFHPDDHKFEGVRATHQPSPWISDYGHFCVMPQTGEAVKPGARERSSAYRREEAVFAPHYFRADLLRYDCRLELTPTERCALLRCHFRADAEADPFAAASPRRLLFDPLRGESHVEILPDARTVRGYTRGNSGGVPENFALYFVAVLDTPLTGWGVFQGREVQVGATEHTSERAGAYVEFAPGEQTVSVRIGTSFIGWEQAERNLALEIGDLSFDDVRERGEAIWNATLGRIQIEGGSEEQQRTFYSCLYRTQLFPRMFHEPGEDGTPVHFSPYDGKVYPGPLYTDNGFWDTYRTVYPLFSLLCPERLGEILEGWINAYRESGWFPTWASPGHRSCMVGTHIDAVVADAVVKKIGGFTVETAYEGILQHSTRLVSGDTGFGREGLEEFQTLGYVASDHLHAAASRTIDYAYDDFCVAQAARALGRSEDHDLLIERATYWRNVFDPSVGLMRGRNADGSWRTPWDPFEWGGPFVEGGTWQHTWAVPHDPAGLITAMGGSDAFIATLEKMLSLPTHFRVGSYGFEIHEMTEVACAAPGFGQYAHSNQPVHHVLYLFACAGRPERMRHWVQRVMNEMYSSNGFPGDEDNGEMAAWYVLSALGVFPYCPGRPEYVLGAPLFSAAHLTLSDGRTLTIGADSTEAETTVSRNGIAWDRLWISHADLMEGGELRFALSNVEPSDRTYTAEQLPPSQSPYPA